MTSLLEQVKAKAKTIFDSALLEGDLTKEVTEEEWVKVSNVEDALATVEQQIKDEIDSNSKELREKTEKKHGVDKEKTMTLNIHDRRVSVLHARIEYLQWILVLLFGSEEKKEP